MKKMSDNNNIQENQVDIVQNFKTAVKNGQTRLALEFLVDIVDGILDIVLTPQEEAPVQNETKEQKQPTSKKKAKEQVTETQANTVS